MRVDLAFQHLVGRDPLPTEEIQRPLLHERHHDSSIERSTIRLGARQLTFSKIEVIHRLWSPSRSRRQPVPQFCIVCLGLAITPLIVVGREYCAPEELLESFLSRPTLAGREAA